MLARLGIYASSPAYASVPNDLPVGALFAAVPEPVPLSMGLSHFRTFWQMVASVDDWHRYFDTRTFHVVVAPDVLVAAYASRGQVAGAAPQRPAPAPQADERTTRAMVGALDDDGYTYRDYTPEVYALFGATPGEPVEKVASLATQCEDSHAALWRKMRAWSSFTLIKERTVVLLISRPGGAREPVTGFCLAHLQLHSLPVVPLISLGFYRVPAFMQAAVVRQLQAAIVAEPSAGVVVEKPVRSVLVDYQSSPIALLAAYMQHRRWVWFLDSLGDSTDAAEPAATSDVTADSSSGVDRRALELYAAEAILRSRLREGFRIVLNRAGYLTLLHEVRMLVNGDATEECAGAGRAASGQASSLSLALSSASPSSSSGAAAAAAARTTYHCLMQFVLFPVKPHEPLVTELWIEPQAGRVASSSGDPTALPVAGQTYCDIVRTVYRRDLRRVRALTTFEYVNRLLHLAAERYEGVRRRTCTRTR